MKKLMWLVIFSIGLCLTIKAQVNVFTTKSNLYKNRYITFKDSLPAGKFDTTESTKDLLKKIKHEYNAARKTAVNDKNSKIETLNPKDLDFHEKMDKILNDYKKYIEHANHDRLRRYEKLYFQKIQSDGLTFFPTKNRVFTKLYYNSTTDKSVESLRSGFLNFNSNGRSLYTEFISGYLPFGRLSFGGQYSYTDIEQASPDSITNIPQVEVNEYFQRVQERNGKKTTVQNFLGGGGNAIINFSSSILAWENREAKFDLVFSERLSFNIPKISSTLEKPSYFFDTGLEAFFSYDLSSSSDATFGFFTKVRASRVSGGTSFYSNLGVDNAFTYYDLALGLNLFKQFRVAYNFTHVSNSNLTFPGFVAVSFTPAQ